jgi:hypothetical protein
MPRAPASTPGFNCHSCTESEWAGNCDGHASGEARGWNLEWPSRCCSCLSESSLGTIRTTSKGATEQREERVVGLFKTGTSGMLVRRPLAQQINLLCLVSLSLLFSFSCLFFPRPPFLVISFSSIAAMCQFPTCDRFPGGLLRAFRSRLEGATHTLQRRTKEHYRIPHPRFSS